jgi:isopentenyl-diphosphate delta-isomerase
LLQQRALTKYHSGGKWANTCCTHPHWGEEFEACAHRRLREELGISNVELNHTDQIEYRANVGNGLIEHELAEIYLAEVALDLPMALNRDEVAAARWADIDVLCEDVAAHPDRYSAWLAIYLRDHSARIFGALPPK